MSLRKKREQKLMNAKKKKKIPTLLPTIKN